MNKKNKALFVGFTSSFIALSIATSFFFGYILGAKGIGADSIVVNKIKGQPKDVDFGQFWDAWNILESKYNGQLDRSKLIQGAISGMTHATGDPYTSYLDPDQLKMLDEELQGSFEGIGAEIGIKDDIITIISPLEGTPAKKADIRAGDKVIKIDDKSTEGMTVEQAVALIKGPKGSTVSLMIIRNDETIEKKIERDTISVKSTSYEVKNSNVGYISINSFGEEAANEVLSAIKDLESKNVKSYIVDVRGNPGGYLDSAVEIASYFVDPGIVVWEKSKNSEEATKTSADRIIKNKSVVVLIDSGSASASEIFAGALRDRNGVKLIGEKSFGKGSVQVVENLKLGALKITIAEWLTPKKIQINKMGLSPDVEVKLSEDDMKSNRDPQLDKALELLKN